MTVQTSDIPISWSYLPQSRKDIHCPRVDVETLIKLQVQEDERRANSVVIPLADKTRLLEIFSWLMVEDYRSNYIMCARVTWRQKAFYCERAINALRFDFEDHVLALCFRMRWG